MQLKTKIADNMNFFVPSFLIFNVLFFSVCEVKSERGKGNCELRTITNRTIYGSEWHSGVILDPVNDFEETFAVISQFYYENIQAITKPNHNDVTDYFFPYLDWTVNMLSIKTDHYFTKYEERATKLEHRFKVEFLCQNDEPSEITFIIPIKDTNNHQPEFLNGPYEFTIPMPVPHGYRLDLTGKIAARDIDLTNKRILFSLDRNLKNADAFIVSSFGPDAEDVKNHPATCLTLTPVDLEDDVTYTLYATDTGNPPRTSNTSVKIIVDKENSFPRFKRSLYTSNFTSFIPSFTTPTMNNGVLLSLLEENIIIDRGYKGIKKIEVKDVDNANKDDFQLTTVEYADSIAVHIEWINLTEELWQQNVVTLILAVTTDTADATTVVQILLPGTSKDKPTSNEVPCVESEGVQSIVKEVSNGGYIAAIVILSLISAGLSGYIIYFFFYV